MWTIGTLGAVGIGLTVAGAILQVLLDRRPAEKPEKPKKPAGASDATTADATTDALGPGILIPWALSLIGWLLRKGKTGYALLVVGVVLLGVDLLRDDGEKTTNGGEKTTNGGEKTTTKPAAPNIVGSQATVVRGTVRLKMRCPRPNTCQAKVDLVRSNRVLARTARPARVGPQRTRSVYVPLTRRGRQVVRARAQFGARVRVGGKRKGRITVRRG
jgi:hypothetical protein